MEAASVLQPEPAPAAQVAGTTAKVTFPPTKTCNIIKPPGLLTPLRSTKLNDKLPAAHMITKLRDYDYVLSLVGFAQ